MFHTLVATELPWRIEDACGEVTGHPVEITAFLDPWWAGWSVGSRLKSGTSAGSRRPLTGAVT